MGNTTSDIDKKSFDEIKTSLSKLNMSLSQACEISVREALSRLEKLVNPESYNDDGTFDVDNDDRLITLDEEDIQINMELITKQIVIYTLLQHGILDADAVTQAQIDEIKNAVDEYCVAVEVSYSEDENATPLVRPDIPASVIDAAIERNAALKRDALERNSTAAKMPTLEKLSTLDKMPTLERTSTIGRIPTMDRIPTFDRIPTLDGTSTLADYSTFRRQSTFAAGGDEYN